MNLRPEDKTGIQHPFTGVILDDLDLRNVVITYDGDSDTLLVHFFGRGIPGVSVDAGDGAFKPLDRDRPRVIGVHIEHFLAVYAPDHPEMLDILDLAELRDIGIQELAAIGREIANQHKNIVLKHVMAGFQLVGTAAD